MIRAIAVAGLLFLSPALTGAAAVPAPQDPASASATAQTPSSSSSSSTASQPAAATSAKSKPKKVWTNDNVSDASGTVSVVGSTSSSGSGRPKAQPKPDSSAQVDPKVLASLRDQLQRLRAQLDIVDRQLSDLKAANKGESRSSTGLNQNTYVYDSSSMEEQIQHLQEKKKRLQATIDELLDAARKAGIEPGQLR
jgi:chromosome segregation ATPase